MAQENRHLTTEQLSAFLDGEVSAEEQAEWEVHLSTCLQCQGVLSGLRQTVALLHMLPEPTLPRSFVLPVEAAVSIVTRAEEDEPVVLPRRANVPTPIRPARRSINPYVRGVLRTISALAAMIGVVFFLSGISPTLTLGHGSNSTATSSSGASGSAASSTFSTPANKPQIEGPQKTRMPDSKPTATAITSIMPHSTPLNGSQKSNNSTNFAPFSWPTFFIFNLSSPVGRVGLGMILVILGIMGVVLFKRVV